MLKQVNAGKKITFNERETFSEELTFSLKHHVIMPSQLSKNFLFTESKLKLHRSTKLLSKSCKTTLNSCLYTFRGVVEIKCSRN